MESKVGGPEGNDAAWAKDFPRLHELYSESDTDNADNYFRQDGVMRALKGRRDSLREIEKELQELDDLAWTQLKAKTLKYVSKKDVRRHYAQLFECLHEVKGYMFLKREGYKEIYFNEEIDTKSPDLWARRNQSVAAIEVKTVNESDQEVNYIEGEQDYFDPELNRKVRPARKWTTKLAAARDEKLKDKLKKTIDLAKSQLLEFSSDDGVRKIILLVIRLDSHLRATGNRDELAEFIKGRAGDQIEVAYLFL